MFNDVFKVTRNDYKNFIETLKRGCWHAQVTQPDEQHESIEIYSIKNNKRLSCRVYAIDDKINETEEYYIFELPDADEQVPPKAKVQVTLDDPKQIQALLDAIKKMGEKQND